MSPEVRPLTIAVDFDGTIVEHRYPAIGKEIPFAFQVLRELQQRGFRLILWTYRHGEALEAAVAYCRAQGIEFYAVNANHPDEPYDPAQESRKILADLYIDDRNVGGFLGWAAIRNHLLGEGLQAPAKRRWGLF